MVVCSYFIAVNLVAFFVFSIDKLRAKNGRWRIPESMLLLLAVIGGSAGAYSGMKLWHHKTLHNKFRFGIPVIMFLQLAIIVYFFFIR